MRCSLWIMLSICVILFKYSSDVISSAFRRCKLAMELNVR
jgi:hypothetical protein